MKLELFSTLEEKAGISQETAINIIRSAPNRYKVFSIAKRNSEKKRIIAHPSKELKILQSLMGNKIAEHCPINACAHAYVKGRSIKTNALAHVNNQYLLKMDFKNFFPNIKPEDFLFHLEKSTPFELSPFDKKAIELLFFWHNNEHDRLELSIGAPSSPFISNFVMHDFDKILQDFCRKFNVTYTRYADDLCFSTNEQGKLILIEAFVIETSEKAKHPTLIVNTEKTIHTSKKHNRHVTGLTISNDSKISLGRDRKRLYRVLVHKYSQGRLSQEEADSLKGFLAFASDVEPAFIVRLQKQFGYEIIRNLVSSSKASVGAKGDYAEENLALYLMQAKSDVANKRFSDALTKLSLIIDQETDYLNERITLIKCEAYYRMVVSYANLKKIELATIAIKNFEKYLNQTVSVQSARFLARAYRQIYSLCVDANLNEQAANYRNSHLALIQLFPEDFELKRTAQSFLQNQ